MAHAFDLEKYRTVSNSGTLCEDNVPADIGIRIIRLRDEGLFDFTMFGPSITSPNLNQNGISNWKTTEIFGLVATCRNKWMSAVVDLRRQANTEGKPKFWFPFQDEWDFQGKPELLSEIAPRLARAGEDLFTSIFERNCNDGLKEIGQSIRSRLRSPDQHVAITSNKFFLPWGMLYTHPVENAQLAPDGSNWEKNGFWGYRHIVQQTPETYKLENVLQADAGGSVPASVNFDDRLSTALSLPVIDQHIEFLRKLWAKTQRTKKSELELGFTQNRHSLERILYFYCHGTGGDSAASTSPPHLEFPDDVVSAFDFALWSNGEKLPTSPLVFINACQGGQMTTMFYESFAVELLKEGAVGLIGAQIDVPAVFGVEYAKHIFVGFFAREKGQKVRLGPLLRDVNRKLWDKYNNPLGLVYSLYRGVDCFIDWSACTASEECPLSAPSHSQGSVS